MKSLRITLAVAGLFLAGPLFAQQGVQATVPFGFYVGDSQLMPSGTYRITPCNINNTAVVVRNCNEGVAAFHLTQPTDAKNKDNGKLVFHKYGDMYFLSEVQGPGLTTNLVLPVAKNEKKVQEDKATVTTFETVTVPKADQAKPPKQ